MECMNWPLEEWKKISRKRAAKEFHNLETLPISPIDPIEKYERIRCQWLAIHRTDLPNFNDESGSSIDEPTFKRLQWQKTYEWLRICVDTEDKGIRFYFAIRDLDREECVRQILYPQNDKISVFQSDDQIDPKMRNYYLNYLGLWFLRRYDRKTASRIIDELYQTDGCHTLCFFALWSSIFFVALTICSFTSFFFVSLYSRLDTYLSEWPFFRDIFVRLLVCGVYALIIGKAVEIFKWSAKMRLILPRLLCATFLGYIVLVIGEEVWKYGVTVSWWIRLPLIVGSLVLAFFYLRTEIGNTIGADAEKSKIVLTRTWRIWWRGLLYGLGLGLVLMDVLCAQFLQNMGNEKMLAAVKGNLCRGFFGLIEWRTWLLFSSIAFLIGIFVQIIWEDKPITEPL